MRVRGEARANRAFFAWHASRITRRMSGEHEQTSANAKPRARNWRGSLELLGFRGESTCAPLIGDILGLINGRDESAAPRLDSFMNNYHDLHYLSGRYFHIYDKKKKKRFNGYSLICIISLISRWVSWRMPRRKCMYILNAIVQRELLM